MRTPIITFLSGLFFGCIVWHCASMLISNPLILPQPMKVFKVIFEAPWYYLTISARTLAYAGGGLAISGFIGLFFALLTIAWKQFEAMYPIFVAIKAMPAVVFAPLLAAMLGSGPLVKVLVAALISLFPVIVSSLEGARIMPQSLKVLGFVYGAPKWNMVRKLYIVYILNGWFGGIKAAAPLAIVGAIVAEFVDPSDLAHGGVGLDIAIKKSSIQIPHLYAGAVVAMALGISVFAMTHVMSRFYQRRYSIGN